MINNFYQGSVLRGRTSANHHGLTEKRPAEQGLVQPSGPFMKLVLFAASFTAENQLTWAVLPGKAEKR